MSGGVDSSVAALLLKREGYHVSGVTMCLGIAAGGDSARCCGADAIDDARRVCDQLAIPHYVLDYSAQLEEQVIAKFIREYQNGRTPNPCVECNRHLKFSSLLTKALGFGFDYLATGHYAAIEKNEDRYVLKRPKDRKKDQTYFLYPISYGKLKHILFPLAALTKEEVKAIAKKEVLSVAEKPESQDICFVTQKNYHEFLRQRIPERKPGPIVDRQGKTLGRHRGIVFHTVGQRGGLGISHATPLYVVSIDAGKNQIVVGERNDLMARGLVAEAVNLLAQTWPRQVHAKIRYRKKEALCTATEENGRFKVIFSEEQEAITPGQSIVFYADDRVLGGGEIREVLHGDC